MSVRAEWPESADDGPGFRTCLSCGSHRLRFRDGEQYAPPGVSS